MKNLTKNSHLRCRYYDALLSMLVSDVSSKFMGCKNLTVNSMDGLRSNHNGSRGLININEDVDESTPSLFAEFILSIPLAPG